MRILLKRHFTQKFKIHIFFFLPIVLHLDSFGLSRRALQIVMDIMELQNMALCLWVSKDRKLSNAVFMGERQVNINKDNISRLEHDEQRLDERC